ncbi:MAG: hypothetical protein VX278_05375, partial [Myxococcota bacterium]|nr:hypothetical protein [Myxococcota bacterium]
METKYWNALLSKDYADIHGLIAQLIDASLDDPLLVEREFQWFGIDKNGAVRLPPHAPPRLKEAPHLIAFLHWKEGFIAAQRLIQERQKIREFLGSTEIEEVRVGLNLLESLAIDKPNMFDLIIGSIEEGKYGIQIPKWLQLAPFRSYVCVYALAWKAKNGDPVQRGRTALKMGS